MPENNSININRQVKTNNAVSNHSGDNIEETIRRLKINDKQEQGDMSQSSQYPDRPGEPDCGYYLRTGMCGYGYNCRFNHPPYAAQGMLYREELPERVGQPDCGYYIKTGTCKYGSSCKYHHPRDRNGAGPVSLNVLGLPMRQDEKSCDYYMRTGGCKFGVACKFHHPPPAASLGAGLPLNGPAAFGSTSSSVVQSMALPYVGGYPTYTLPRAPYLTGPRVQAPQAYMPVVISPHQGVVPPQGWNTYVGNLGPMSSSVLGSNLVYNSRNQGESGSSGQVQLLSTTSTNLPERPDQPECRHFMNNGTCKYGSECKYHHPREKIAQLAASTIGPLGLPLRPGQPVCSNYSMHGLCKYGPSCRFDHPFSYPYNYLSLPQLPMFDSSMMPFPAMPSTDLSSEIPASIASKFSGWAPNSDGDSNKHHSPDSNTKISEDPPEQDGSPLPQSSRASSEPSHD